MTPIPSASDRPRPRRRPSDLGDPIVIGLVNNMPDAALRSTERQYRELLCAAADGLPVVLRLFTLPDLPRGDFGRSQVDQRYEDIGRLRAGRLDGLIVTGTEPKAAALTDEPYWSNLTQLIDWAQSHTASTVWSCLAAHAAVLYLDDIGRRPLARKLVGVFDCQKTADHALVAGTASRWRFPHSRCNEVPEEALARHGYDILSNSAEAGADMFIKQKNSLFVFFQGHPEYDVGALAREYRRDVRRFLGHERYNYPPAPTGYFDTPTLQMLTALRQLALCGQDVDLDAHLPTIAAAAELTNGWSRPAVRIYSNWLSYLSQHKSQSLAAENAPVAAFERVVN